MYVNTYTHTSLSVPLFFSGDIVAAIACCGWEAVPCCAGLLGIPSICSKVKANNALKHCTHTNMHTPCSYVHTYVLCMKSA